VIYLAILAVQNSALSRNISFLFQSHDYLFGSRIIAHRAARAENRIPSSWNGEIFGIIISPTYRKTTTMTMISSG
jgi:hypothetical protein